MIKLDNVCYYLNLIRADGVDWLLFNSLFGLFLIMESKEDEPFLNQSCGSCPLQLKEWSKEEM